jgi:hypothetical protein
MVYSGAWEKPTHEKKSRKSCDTVPLMRRSFVILRQSKATYLIFYILQKLIYLNCFKKKASRGRLENPSMIDLSRFSCKV